MTFKYKLSKDRKIYYFQLINIFSGYKGSKTRTSLLAFDRSFLKDKNMTKLQKLNIWNWCAWFCSCTRGMCTITPCSHIMMFWKCTYLYQNGKKIKDIKLHEDILEGVVSTSLYNKWSLLWEIYCLSECSCVGVEKGMIKCTGCKNYYHVDCISKYQNKPKKYYEKLPKNWICDVKQKCAYLRNNKFISQYLFDMDKQNE